MDAVRTSHFKSLGDASDHTPPDDAPGPSGATTKRRAQISVACDSCRAKKIKCSGDRPTCAFCEDRKIECTYDRDPDVTRLVSLRRRHAVLEQDADIMRRLIDTLHGASHHDAQEVLRRMRLQHSTDDLLRNLREGQLLAASPEAGNISPAILAEASSAMQMSAQLAPMHFRADSSPSNQRSPALAPSNPMRIENLLLGRNASDANSRPSTSQSLTGTAAEQRGNDGEHEPRMRQPR